MSPFSAAADTIGIPLGGVPCCAARDVSSPPVVKKEYTPMARRRTASSQISLRFSKIRDIVSFGLSSSDYFE
jgi:hypothetical protein